MRHVIWYYKPFQATLIIFYPSLIHFESPCNLFVSTTNRITCIWT